ncbi:MAG TPA: hypothetical protein VE988_17675, partial [Gemmataceae bacterium]|nr:hypothetical protein [Gemmataceae bacterium]
MSPRKWVVRGLVALVLAGCLGAGVVYQQWTNPAAVREQVEDMLGRQFPGILPTVGSAHLRLFGGVVLTELHLLRRDDDKQDLIYIPEATVFPDKERLLDGKVAFRRIELLKPIVHITRGKDGHWNIGGLTNKSTATGPLPTIVIQHGTLVIKDNFAGPLTVELHDVNMTLLNDAPNCLSISGSAESDSAGAVEIRGSWNRGTNAWTLSCRTTGLCINKELVQYAASQCKEDRLKDLQIDAKVDIAAELSYQPDAVPPLKHDIRCVLRQASVEHPKLPERLHNLSAVLHCDGNKLILENLKAAVGSGKVECKGWADLTDPENNFGGEMTAYHLPLTREMANRLPEKVYFLYDRFQPVGTAKIGVVAERAKGEWVRCLCKFQPEDIGVCFKNFKYPLERFSGVLDFDYVTNASTFEAVGYNGDHPITVRGTWKNSGINADGQIEISGHDMPLDDRLMN